MRKKALALILILFLFSSVVVFPALVSAKMGITYVPGKLKIQAKLGKSYTVNQPIIVGSLCNDERTFTLKFVKPANFMEGYTTLPDFNWISFSENNFTLRSHGKKTVYLSINIPDKDEYYNKHWEVWVHGYPLRKPGERVFFKTEVYARILIDTPKKIPVRYISIDTMTLLGLTCFAASAFIGVGTYAYHRRIQNKPYKEEKKNLEDLYRRYGGRY